MKCVSIIITLALVFSCTSKRQAIEVRQEKMSVEALQGLTLHDTVLLMGVNITDTTLQEADIFHNLTAHNGALAIRHTALDKRTTTTIAKKDTTYHESSKGILKDKFPCFVFSSLSFFCAALLFFLFVVRRLLRAVKRDNKA